MDSSLVSRLQILGKALYKHIAASLITVEVLLNTMIYWLLRRYPFLCRWYSTHNIASIHILETLFIWHCAVEIKGQQGGLFCCRHSDYGGRGAQRWVVVYDCCSWPVMYIQGEALVLMFNKVKINHNFQASHLVWWTGPLPVSYVSTYCRVNAVLTW